MQITTTDAGRFAIIAFTLFLTFRLLADSAFQFLVRYVLSITIAAFIVIVWKLYPFIAWCVDWISYFSNKFEEVCMKKEEYTQYFWDIPSKVKETISSLRDAVSSAVASLLGWLWPSLWEEWQRFENKETPEEVQMRVALLVSTKSGPSHEAVLRAFNAFMPFDTPRLSNHPEIKWDSTETTLLHRPHEQAAFVRSFSVCLIPYFVWADDTKTLLEKFSCGTYWEYLGEGKHLAGDCLGWGEDRIKTIDSVLELGLCTYTNDIMSQELFKPLCDTWTGYDPVWWNTLDFAIRQAWLLADYGDKRRELKNLYNILTKQRFYGALQRIFSGSDLFRWLSTLPCGEILVFLSAVVPGGMLTWPFTFGVDWNVLGNVLPGLCREWDKEAMEVESAIPQLHGLIDK